MVVSEVVSRGGCSSGMEFEGAAVVEDCSSGMEFEGAAVVEDCSSGMEFEGAAVVEDCSSKEFGCFSESPVVT